MPPKKVSTPPVELPSQVFVTRTFQTEETTTEEVIAVHKFVTEPGKVDFSAGLTVNLGNHEFVRLNVGVVVPTYREELEPAYDFAKQFVTERLKAEVEEIKSKGKKAVVPKAEDPF